MVYHVDGQIFKSIPVSPVGDMSSPPPIITDDLEVVDFCPYCELRFGMKVRPSGNPFGEGRFVVVGGKTKYPVCHIHARQSGKIKTLPTQIPA